MSIDTKIIIEAGAILAAFLTIIKTVKAIFKWIEKQEKQTHDIEALRKKESQEIEAVQSELYVISHALLACLDGLQQLNCNGNVTEAYDKLSEHLNLAAHGNPTEK